jgi:adenine-specific DNA glycosylase
VPTLAWDTNLEKVFSRYFYGTKDKKLNAAEKSLIEESMKEYSKIHGNE